MDDSTLHPPTSSPQPTVDPPDSNCLSQPFRDQESSGSPRKRPRLDQTTDLKEVDRSPAISDSDDLKGPNAEASEWNPSYWVPAEHKPRRSNAQRLYSPVRKPSPEAVALLSTSDPSRNLPQPRSAEAELWRTRDLDREEGSKSFAPTSHREGPPTSLTDRDGQREEDEESATQRSLLEELHSIQEEISSSCSMANSNDQGGLHHVENESRISNEELQRPSVEATLPEQHALSFQSNNEQLSKLDGVIPREGGKEVLGEEGSTHCHTASAERQGSPPQSPLSSGRMVHLEEASKPSPSEEELDTSFGGANVQGEVAVGNPLEHGKEAIHLESSDAEACDSALCSEDTPSQGIAPNTAMCEMQTEIHGVTATGMEVIDGCDDHAYLFEDLDDDAFACVELSPVAKIDVSRTVAVRSAAGDGFLSPTRQSRCLPKSAMLTSQSSRKGTSQADEKDEFGDESELLASLNECDVGGGLQSNPIKAEPPPAFLGFRTGANKVLPPPGMAAYQRGMSILFEDGMDADSLPLAPALPKPVGSPGVLKTEGLAAKLKGPHGKMMAGRSQCEDLQRGSPEVEFVGFQSAGGKKLAMPSKAALEAAAKIFAELEDDDELLNIPTSQAQRNQTHQDLGALRMTPSRAHSPAPSAICSRPRTPLLAPTQSKEATVIGSALHSPPPRATVDRATVEATALKSQEAKIDEEKLHSKGKRMMPLATPKRSALTDITNIVTRDAYSTPVRPPATPLSRRVPNTSYHSSAGRSLVTPSLITPAAPKRISLGMTPRGQRAANSNTPGSKRPLFSTPFKGGKRPENPLASPAKPLGSVSHSSRGFNTSRKSQAGVGGIASIANVERAVFDLRCEVPRVGMREYGIKPESVTPLQAVAKGAPDEIISILQEPSLAAMYAFDGPDGNLLRPVSALAEIRESGCRHVDIKWVNCHWDLILWKLASLCLNKPEEARVRFSWPELIRQMKYRYEREINLAQRSCIKRIQEHDSSASSPMVLCVYKVLWDRDDALERGKGTGEREGGVAANMMELTDGWYRIRCSIDSVLSAALARGRIKVGHKLAIMGAKLQSKGEPAEVLDAFATSIISISGNSTSLAKWDARLGFCREPFYASLRSLTADGGLVAAMDVVITQVYPYAYFDIDKGQTGQQSARGEAEESACKEAYERRYKETKAKLEQGWASKGRRLDRLLLALESVAEDVRDQETNPGIDDGGLEEQARDLLSQLEWEDNPEMAVRQLVVQSGKLGLLPFLVQAARQKCYFEREDDGYALEAELSKLCPPRKVRNFRVVKFRDARLPPPATNLSNSESRMKLKEGDDEAPGTMDKRRRSLRTVQLTVWDAINLGDGLEVGRRYIVTNLVPTQKSSWRGSDVEADIFLSTRRDTKWRLVDDR